MTTNLGAPQLATNQSSKEVTINDAIGTIDGAITDTLSIPVTSSNAVSVSVADLQTHFIFDLTGSAATGAVAVTLPAGVLRGLILIANDCGQTATVKVSGDSGAGVTIPNGGKALVSVGVATATALVAGTSDGTVQFVAGSAASPAVKIGDTDTGIYGSGSVLRFSIDGVERAVLNQYGMSVGEPSDPTNPVGFAYIASASSPTGGAAELLLQGEAVANNIVHINVSTATPPALRMVKGRGTIASPTIPASGDQLGVVKFQGDNAAGGIINGASIQVVVTEPSPSTSKLGSQMQFIASPLGSATQTEVMRLEADLGLSMFGANPVIDQNRIFHLRSYTIATLPASGAGEMIFVSDLGGGGGLAVSDGSHWKRMRPGQQSVATDADFTLAVLTNAEQQRHTGTLTANRTITLSTTGASAGDRFQISRSGSGSFTLSVGGLKTLATATWAEVAFDGSAWYLAASGSI